MTADVQAVVKNFNSIRNEASGFLKVSLKKARLSVGNQDQLLLVFEDEMQEKFVNTPEHMEELRNIIEEKIGKTVDIETKHMEVGRRFEDNFVDIEKVINMDITVED